ncbi:hypothetical protein BDM02DRAFT_3192908 [Thelephora ganbajun]|uniref:Uncharacterized protein n=1 Tax=Thelephora ganbajun TaxID=370292 RepID=A0ACB6YZK4_THEGA|nr:hypothetical protein BDM02DRAFT_3192908 [Thelephora ganbajun]
MSFPLYLQVSRQLIHKTHCLYSVTLPQFLDVGGASNSESKQSSATPCHSAQLCAQGYLLRRIEFLYSMAIGNIGGVVTKPLPVKPHITDGSLDQYRFQLAWLECYNHGRSITTVDSATKHFGTSQWGAHKNYSVSINLKTPVISRRPALGSFHDVFIIDLSGDPKKTYDTSSDKPPPTSSVMFKLGSGAHMSNIDVYHITIDDASLGITSTTSSSPRPWNQQSFSGSAPPRM